MPVTIWKWACVFSCWKFVQAIFTRRQRYRKHKQQTVAASTEIESVCVINYKLSKQREMQKNVFSFLVAKLQMRLSNGLVTAMTNNKERLLIEQHGHSVLVVAGIWVGWAWKTVEHIVQQGNLRAVTIILSGRKSHIFIKSTARFSRFYA